MSTLFARKAAQFKAKLAENKAAADRMEAEAARQARIAAMPPLRRQRIDLQHRITTARNWPRRPDPKIHRDPAKLGRGWLLPCLLAIDDHLWGRWDYWARTTLAGRLLDEPIPQIDFGHEGNMDRSPCRRMLEASLNSIPRHGEWRTWGSWQYLDYFFDWLLFGFGHSHEPPKEPEEGAFSRLYQVFCLDAMLAWPYDYFGDMMSEQQHGRHLGFYPTPHVVADFMTRINFRDAGESGRDTRTQTVNDPCVGTGRMLLFASNHSLCLSGADINATCVKSTLVNMWMYAPWGAKPFPFLA
ncbi:MAG: hypothetical protein QOE70_401 [Chthoniobacter sp.]|jgi:hypothetical protein|nr:hypothetical protein [Chthoniobacter sp.]